jgi:glyoxylase-like metal-dependent hydrolase (beta-lactamase superfamily II)
MEEKEMVKSLIARVIVALFLCSILLATCALAQEVAPFSASQLVKVGDKIRYGVYTIRKIGEGIYQMNNRDSRPPVGGPGEAGVDMYLICGKTKALMIDLGINYTKGTNNIPPRKIGAEELRAMISGLAGKLPLEITVTHMHGDHDGMTGAFLNGAYLNQKVNFWAGEGEDASQLKTQLDLDPSIYQFFKHGQKTFDLGGRIVETFLLKGHTLGGTVYILKSENMLFSGDCFGNGEGLGMSTGERIKMFAQDSQRMADYVLVNFSPYERYTLRIYSGHSWENGNEGIQVTSTPIDVGYLDWRFLQDIAACANGIVKGKWLVAGSGLRFVETTATDPRGGNSGRGGGAPGDKRGSMIYGIGSMMGSLQAAKDAAGIKIP